MDKIRNQGLGPVVEELAEVIVANKAWLSEIDGKIGDGDHGIAGQLDLAVLVGGLQAQPGTAFAVHLEQLGHRAAAGDRLAHLGDRDEAHTVAADAGLRHPVGQQPPQVAHAQHAVGEEVAVSDWVTVTQDQVNRFADATGDHQWIHVDVERCKTDMPDGKTIAHGNLTFSVISTFGKDVLKIENVRNGINYGSNKVRYTSPVQVGARIRGRQKLLAADDMKDGGIRMTPR